MVSVEPPSAACLVTSGSRADWLAAAEGGAHVLGEVVDHHLDGRRQGPGAAQQLVDG
jgi:hypothetical protein